MEGCSILDGDVNPIYSTRKSKNGFGVFSWEVLRGKVVIIGVEALLPEWAAEQIAITLNYEYTQWMKPTKHLN